MTDAELKRHVATLALGELNAPTPVDESAAIVANYLSVVDGAVVVTGFIVPSGNGGWRAVQGTVPRTRADRLGSGRELPIPVTELVTELRATDMGFWR